MSARRGPAAPPGALTLVRRFSRHRRFLYVLNALLWGAIHALPVLIGLLLKALFDALAADGPATTSPWSFLLLVLALDLGRIALLGVGTWTWSSYLIDLTLRVRRNLLGYLLTAPGARRLPGSSSEAITRFRDDVDDLGEYVEDWVDFWGLALFALLALGVMVTIEPRLTALVLLPLLGALLLTQALRPHIRQARRRAREATGAVTDFIGEVVGAVQAVKAAGARASVLTHFERLNRERRRTAVRDALVTEGFRSVTDGMINVAIGFMLLLAAGAVGRGDFSVGDFALFLAYLPRLTQAITFMGGMLVRHRRAEVAFERLLALLHDARPDHITSLPPLPERDEPPPPRPSADPRLAAPLRELRVRDLSFRHPGGAGIEGVSFALPRGSFTVVTGPVGSGKSTLLRVLLGLLPRDGGEIRWNGAPIDDPASVLVPPRAAYTPQVPRLFSDTLRENVTLGRPVDDATLQRALEQAVLAPDVARLERGLDTAVGARGVKLSGGQVQRAAAARMFLCDAELLLVDDLSSALDAATEARLWRTLRGPEAAGGGATTWLVVSHRRAALQRADRIALLEGGRLVAFGPLPELLRRSPAMRRLWREETAVSSAAAPPPAQGV